MKQIRVAIVDDHAPFRNVLRGILEREHDFDVVAEAENGISAVEVVDDKRPSVVLMDINMPQMDGLTATKIITSKHPELKVIVLSMHTDYHVQILAQKAGASHFLSKGCNPKAIVSIIRDVHPNSFCLNGTHIARSLCSDFTELIAVAESAHMWPAKPPLKPSSIHPIRIVIVDDHPAFRDSLRLIIEREPDMSVVAVVGDGLAAIEMVEKYQPDVLLIDVRLPKMDGIESTRIIISKRSETKVIALTLFTDDCTRMKALEAGACYCWSKESHVAGLLAVIRDAHQNL